MFNFTFSRSCSCQTYLPTVLLLLFGLHLGLAPSLQAQQSFWGTPETIRTPTLEQKFKHYEVFQIDAAGFAAALRHGAPTAHTELKLGDLDWDLELSPNDLFPADYQVKTLMPDGSIQTRVGAPNIAFKGFETKTNGRVRLTVDDNFIYGLVEDTEETWFIEPLRYFLPDAAEDLFIVYPQSGVVPMEGLTCGTEHSEELMHKYEEEAHDKVKNGGADAKLLACYEIELAIASDRSMFDKYGGAGVEAHNVAVINSILPNFASSFIHVLEFVIVTQFIVTGTDPWTTSTDPGALLGSFRTWGQAGNFGVTFDLGELWTNRTFPGGVIGIAYLNGLCNSLKYHVLRDFSTNGDFLRVLTAHEIGHNLDMQHDGSGCPSGFIMCPSVNTSNTWSTASINSANATIQNRLNAGGCLSPCGGGGGGGGGTPPAADFSWSPNPPCQGQQVTFTDQSTGTYQTTNWVFPGGTPNSSTQANPVVTWNTPGTYNVRLTVGGTNGTATLVQQVVVQGLPVANFTFTVSGTTVTFTNTSTGGANSFVWDFGDGNTSTDPNPIHTYATGNSYTVKLTATNNCGSQMVTKIVNTAPTANFTANRQQGCPPLVVTFTNQSSPNATSYVWSFPGGTPASSTAVNPVITYNTPGIFDVSLTAINAAGQGFEVKQSYIFVDAPPTASFTANVSGMTVSLTNNSVNATSYLWNFGDNTTSTAFEPTHTYTQPGTYTITLTATNACGTDVFTQTVVISPSPMASFIASPRTGCSPLVVEFTNTTTGNATSYAWQFPGGTPSTSTDTDPTVVYQTAGTFSVTLVASNASGNSTATQTNYISVAPGPVPNFNFTVNGRTVAFTNTSTNSTNYSWDFGDGNTSASENPTHTYANDGAYTVVLTAANNCGVASQTRTINISTPPTANFNAVNRVGCGPLSVAFSNASSSNAATFAWQFPGGTPATSTVANPTVVYNTPGNYNVTLVVSNPAGSNTATQTNYVTVNPPAVAAFSANSAGLVATFTNSSTNATTYAWDFGEPGPNNTSTAANPTHTYAADGIYTVTLTATGACGPVTATQTVTIVTPPTASFSVSNNNGCGPLLAQYTNTSSANALNFSWQFPGGDPATSNLPSPAVVYSAPGTYAALLIVSNAAGMSSTQQLTAVTVQPLPTANFSSTTNGFTAAFANASTNATSYLWNFGGPGPNNTSTDANPSYTYAADGVYTVTLTSSSACGLATTTRMVTIVTPPTANFTVANSTGCAPFAVQYTSTSSANATGFTWSFPGGTPATSTAQNPSVTYAAPGTYSATLTVSNAAGNNTATQSNVVTVNTVPTTSFSSTTNGLTATFANTSSANATSYLWNFGGPGPNNTSTNANPTYTYAADGVYTVTLAATNGCGTTTATQTVTIVTPPTANFTVASSTGCAPFAVQYTSTSSANATGFNWSFPGGTPATSTAQNPSVTYAAPGTYSATLTVSNAAGNNTATQSNVVTVNTVPTTSFSSTANGLTATFANTSSANATSYLWNFGGPGPNNTSTNANPTYTYAADGVYTVTLAATNGCGTTTATQTVTIVTPPTANFTVANSTGCAPFAVQYTSTSSANATGFNWSFPGGTPATSTAQNPSVTYAAPGTYSATLTVSNAAGNNTATQGNVVTVNTVPTTGFNSTTNGLTATFANTSANATSYLWDFGGPGPNNTSTDANPTYTYAADGVYTVTLSSTNGCGTTTATQTVTIATPPTANFTVANSTGCAPFAVQYTNTSSANAATFSWSFPGGTPATSTDQNPTVTYAAAGTYPATLTVSNAAGNNTATQSNVVTVNTVPTTGFNSTTNGLTATFANTSANATSYLWDFGGPGPNNTSTDANPSYTYAADGVYTVTLSSTNGCGTTTATQTVTIATPPTASFSVANGSGCAPFTVQYTNTSSANAATYAWSFPGGTPATSTAPNPTVTYATPGAYSATLTVGNTAGSNTATQANVVTVGASPVAGFSATVSLFTATFSNISTNAGTYLWNFGDGTGSTDAAPTHTYTADGTYTVTLSATNACGTNVYTQQVVVLTSPTAGFTANTTTGCGPLTVQFSDLSSTNTTGWAWSFPGGTPATSTGQNPSVVYSTPGTYDVMLIASTGAGTDTFTQTAFITVNSVPNAGFQQSATGATINFANASNNAVSYLWAFGDGGTSILENPTHTYAASGNFTVQLIAINACGADTFAQQITVAGPPPVGAFTVNQTSGCAPFVVNFTDQSTGNATAWQWVFSGASPNNSTQQNPTVTYNLPGTYSVALVVSNSYGADTVLLTNYITVGAAPLTNFAAAVNQATVNFTNLTPGTNTYLWDFGDGTTSTATNPVHTYTVSGTYTVKLTATNGCGGATQQQTVNVIVVGTENLADAWRLRLFPNPSTGLVNLEAFGLPQEEVHLAVFNALGQMVEQGMRRFDAAQSTQTLDYRHLPAGIYTLQLHIGAQTATVKLVIAE